MKIDVAQNSADQSGNKTRNQQSSFHDYCRTEWGVADDSARLIAAVKKVGKVE